MTTRRLLGQYFDTALLLQMVFYLVMCILWFIVSIIQVVVAFIFWVVWSFIRAVIETNCDQVGDRCVCRTEKQEPITGK